MKEKTQAGYDYAEAIKQWCESQNKDRKINNCEHCNNKNLMGLHTCDKGNMMANPHMLKLAEEAKKHASQAEEAKKQEDQRSQAAYNSEKAVCMSANDPRYEDYLQSIKKHNQIGNIATGYSPSKLNAIEQLLKLDAQERDRILRALGF